MLWFFLGSDSSLLPPLISLDIELTDGAVFLSQMPSLISLSLISQENIPGLILLSSSMRFSTSGVATLGFDPPITPGRMEPVSCKHKRQLKPVVKALILLQASNSTIISQSLSSYELLRTHNEELRSTDHSTSPKLIWWRRACSLRSWTGDGQCPIMQWWILLRYYYCICHRYFLFCIGFCWFFFY